MKVKLTALAEQDLADIAVWLTAEASELTARRIVSELIKRLDGVLAFPESGTPRDRIRPGFASCLRA
jgi:plasmid stabilization system protein ParE